MTEDISILIYRLLVGTLTAEERQRLDRWTAESEENRQVVSRLTDLASLRREYLRRRAVDVSKPLADMQRRVAAASHRTWRRWAVAAVVTGLLAGAYWVGVLQQGRQPAADSVIAGQHQITHGATRAVLTLAGGKAVELRGDSVYNNKVLARARREARSEAAAGEPSAHVLTTPRGGEFRLTLEDGTEVWLNAESELRYPEEFDADERRVEVSGEAYFRVAKDETKPFFVETAGQLIRVTGTEFNVNSYADNAAVYTTLVSGGITTRLTGTGGGDLLLSPGHQTVYAVGSSQMSVRSVDTEVVTSWIRGKFVFENQTLEQIMRLLSRWYDFQYEFLDEESRQTVFMGSVPRYGDFDDVLSILEKSGNLRFRQNNSMIFISRKK